MKVYKVSDRHGTLPVTPSANEDGTWRCRAPPNGHETHTYVNSKQTNGYIKENNAKCAKESIIGSTEDTKSTCSDQDHLYNGTGNPEFSPQDLPSHTLRVDGVSYTVTHRTGSWWKGSFCKQKQEKLILNNVSVYLRSGELTAVLGNSGKCYPRVL